MNEQKQQKSSPSSAHLVKKFWMFYPCDDPIWSHTLGKLPLESAKTKKPRHAQLLLMFITILIFLNIDSR